MTTLIPIEHVARGRQGLLLRRGRQLGEASPLVGRSRECIEDVLRASALGEAPPPSLDFALWSLDAKPGRAPITSQVLLEDARTAVAMAHAAIARGHRAFKLKMRSREDACVLAELRALGTNLVLRVDANRAFATEHDVPWDLLAKASIEWIEEPCPNAGTIAAAPVAIAIDESVAEDPERALDDLDRVRALVLKPTILGATETLRIARACRLRGGRVILSHAFESAIGLRAAEELARQIDPLEIHGLARWDGIDAYRLTASGAPVSSLESAEAPGVDSFLG